MKIKKKIIYKGKEIILELEEGKISQKKIKKEVVVYPKSVVILPLIEKDKIILIRQYRFPAKKDLWEIPAGKLEKGEKPKNGAKRELKEETGYKAKKLKKIAEYYVAPGYTTEYQYLFLASQLEKGKQSFDESEVIKKVKIFSLKEIKKMIKEKKIVDLKTIFAIEKLSNKKIPWLEKEIRM